MFVPSENTANTIFLAITGLPATVFAFALSQTDVALIGIGINVVLAILFKAADLTLRFYFKEKKQ
jgi:hypothetical protein